MPETDDSRRAIGPGRQPGLSVRQPHDAAVTRQELEDVNSGDLDRLLADMAKNVFMSKATAGSVFGRHRLATNSRYRSTSR
jgi:hypothetical protein